MEQVCSDLVNLFRSPVEDLRFFYLFVDQFYFVDGDSFRLLVFFLKRVENSYDRSNSLLLSCLVFE
jgi:hypothetical protein